MKNRPRLSARLAVAAVALVALLLSGMFAAQADARKVANPGTFTASIPGGLFRIKANSFDLADINPDPTLTGTVANNGDFTFTKANINFPPLTFDYNGDTFTVRLQPTNDWTGNINPLSGAGNMRARFKIKVEGTSSGVSLGGSCYIGSDGDPVDVNTAITGTTSPPSPNTPISGTPYNTSNGTVTVVNNSLAINQTASGCATFGLGNGPLNDALGLPSAAGNNDVRLNMDFNPIIQKGVAASFTASPSSGPAPLVSTLNASGSTIPAGIKTCATPLPSTPNCGYRWDFDGNGTVDQVTNTSSTTNAYTLPGTYQTKLTIYDVDGDTDSTTRTVTVNGRPDLTITKTHTGNFISGTQGSYTIGVSNAGNGPTTGTTTVTDTLPSGLSFVSATGTGWTCAGPGGVVTCTRTGVIAPSSSAPGINLTVDVGDAARPAVTNTASVSTPTETVTGNNSASDPTTVDSVDVGIQKTHAGSFRVSRNETYSLRVYNDGTLPTTGTTTVSDSLPVGMSFFSYTAPSGWSCNGAAQSFSCTNPSALPVGYSDTIQLKVAVDNSALPARTNTATVSTPGDTDSSDDSSSDPTVVVAQPDLAIDKSHTGDFRVGAPGTYELAVKNDGALPTTGTTTVTDSVPGALPVVSASGSGWTCNVTGQDVSCDSTAVLQPDESAPEITIVTDVTQAAMPSVTNTAHVATSGVGPSADPNPANDSDSDQTNVGAIDLTIDKNHVGAGFPIGGNGTYTLAVHNAGTAATVGSTTVTDSLPADLTYVGASGSGWTCNASGQDVTCNRAASIPGGASPPTITLNVAVANTTAIDVTNDASVQTTGDVNPANDSDSDTATLTAADLEIEKTHGSDFEAGTTRAYNLKVRNVGSLPTTGTNTVADHLPAGLTYVDASGPDWSCGATGQDVTCTRTSAIVGGGPASTIQVQVAVGAAAVPSVTNTATVSNALDRNPTNDSASDPTTVKANDLSIEKSHAGTLRTGGTATYDIDVENVGTADTRSAATVTDVLPGGLSYSGFTGGDWSCSATGQTVTCEHGSSIPAGGAAQTLHLLTAVGASADTQVVNTASVNVANDPVSGNDSDDDTSGVGRVDVAVDKSHSGDLPRGGASAYRIDVQNGGSVPTVGPVTVTDALPAGLRYSSAGGGGWSCSFAGGTVECTHADPINASAAADTINLEVQIEKNAPGTITNTATVSTRDDADPANNSDSDPANVTAATPDASLSMSPRGDAFHAGGDGTYNLAVRNAGSGPTTGTTTTTLTLPGGVTFVAGNGPGWSCSAAGSVVTCSHPGALAPEARNDIGIDVQVAKNAFLGIWSGSVSTAGDPNPGNDTDSEIMLFSKIDASVAISHQGSFTVGSDGAFSVTVTNGGSSATTSSTVVSDELPNGLEFVSGGGGGWNCGPSGTKVICEHPGALAAGEASSFPINVKPASFAPAQATNTVTVSTQDDADAGNDAASDTVDIAGSRASGIKITGGKIKVKGSKAPIALSCPAGADCSGTLQLGPSAGSATYGSATFSVKAGTVATVNVKLSKAAKKTLAETGKLKAVASVGTSQAKVKLAGHKKKG